MTATWSIDPWLTTRRSGCGQLSCVAANPTDMSRQSSDASSSTSSPSVVRETLKVATSPSSRLVSQATARPTTFSGMWSRFSRIVRCWLGTPLKQPAANISYTRLPLIETTAGVSYGAQIAVISRRSTATSPSSADLVSIRGEIHLALAVSVVRAMPAWSQMMIGPECRFSLASFARLSSCRSNRSLDVYAAMCGLPSRNTSGRELTRAGDAVNATEVNTNP